jgi:hypothetical protein
MTTLTRRSCGLRRKDERGLRSECMTGAGAAHVVTVWAIRASRGTSTWIIQGMPACLTWANLCPRSAFFHLYRNSCERFSLSGGVLRLGSPKQDSNILRVVLSCAATCRCDSEVIFVLLSACVSGLDSLRVSPKLEQV